MNQTITTWTVKEPDMAQLRIIVMTLYAMSTRATIPGEELKMVTVELDKIAHRLMGSPGFGKGPRHD